MELNLFMLTIYGRAFFQMSPEDAYRISQKVVSISSPDDQIVDLITLYDLTWRKNRDENLIEEEERNMPVCYRVSSLPDNLCIEKTKVPSSQNYDHLYEIQKLLPFGKEYEFFPNPRKQLEILKMNLHEGHHHD
jgi:hypothetical protein